MNYKRIGIASQPGMAYNDTNFFCLYTECSEKRPEARIARQTGIKGYGRYRQNGSRKNRTDPCRGRMRGDAAGKAACTRRIPGGLNDFRGGAKHRHRAGRRPLLPEAADADHLWHLHRQQDFPQGSAGAGQAAFAGAAGGGHDDRPVPGAGHHPWQKPPPCPPSQR